MSTEWLEVSDSLNRALSGSTVGVPKLWLDGLQSVKKQVEHGMKKNGLTRVEYTEEFDPNLHKAISTVNDNTKKIGTILYRVRDGWKLRDKLIRPEEVVVIKNND